MENIKTIKNMKKKTIKNMKKKTIKKKTCFDNTSEFNKMIQYLDNVNTLKNKGSKTITSLTKNAFFMKLYKDLLITYSTEKCNKSQIIYNCEPCKVKKGEFKDLQFIAKNTINYITKNLHYKTKYIYKNNIIYHMSIKPIERKIPDIIQHMFTIICIMKKLCKRESFQQIVFYYECNLPKIFPLIKGQLISTENINSAVTMVSEWKNGNIILYRKEEILKVLIHELIHSNLADWNLIISRHPKKYIFIKLFCTNYTIQINEAYTESMATMLYIFYKNIINKGRVHELDIAFERELRYSSYICSQIFNHYKLNSIRDIMKKGDTGKCKTVFLQDSNLFSYYILKNILLRHHIEFGNCLKIGLTDYKIKDIIRKGHKPIYIISDIIDILIKYIYDFDNDVLLPYKNIKYFDKSNSIKMCL